MKTLLIVMSALIGTLSHASTQTDNAAKAAFVGSALSYKAVKCATGYTLIGSNPTTNGIVGNNQAYLCLKVNTQTPSSCGSGIAYATDGKVAGTQVCSGASSQDFCYDQSKPSPCSAINCATGYTRNAVSGTDQCLQTLSVVPTI
jgi:hypothetical protein